MVIAGFGSRLSKKTAWLLYCSASKVCVVQCHIIPYFYIGLHRLQLPRLAGCKLNIVFFGSEFFRYRDADIRSSAQYQNSFHIYLVSAG